MPAEELLVLIVRDPGLRGTLIARLSLDGEQLVTFDGAHDDAALHRTTQGPAILITDDAAVALSFDERAEAARWRGFIQLADDLDTVNLGRTARVSRTDAAVQIRDTLALWRTARTASGS